MVNKVRGKLVKHSLFWLLVIIWLTIYPIAELSRLIIIYPSYGWEGWQIAELASMWVFYILAMTIAWIMMRR